MVVIEIFAAGCFLFILSFHNLATEYPEDSCSSNKNTCNLKQIELLGEHYGIATAIKKYEAIISSEAASFSDCHTLAHGVGVFAYQKLFTVHDALSLHHATLFPEYIMSVVCFFVEKQFILETKVQDPTLVSINTTQYITPGRNDCGYARFICPQPPYIGL